MRDRKGACWQRAANLFQLFTSEGGVCSSFKEIETFCFHPLRTVFSRHSRLRFRQGCTLGNSPHSHWNTHSLYQSQRNTCKRTQTHTQTTCSHSGISTTGLINYSTAAPLSRFSTACCFSVPPLIIQLPLPPLLSQSLLHTWKTVSLWGMSERNKTKYRKEGVHKELDQWRELTLR